MNYRPSPSFSLSICLIASLAFGILLLTAGCTPVPASGPQSDDLTWTLPTTNVDGSALAPASIVSVTINQYASATATTVLSSQTLAGTATSATFPRTGTGVGTFCYDGMVMTTLPSALSTPRVCKTVAAAPNTVVGLAVK